MKTGPEFIEKTKYRHLSRSDQILNLPQPPLELEYDSAAPMIELPQDMAKYTSDLTSDLTTALENRRSLRQYSHQPLTLTELSYLLWYTQGIKKTFAYGSLRTVPSAGARHALETWLVVNNVAGLQAGLYRYIASRHQLALVSHAVDGDLGAEAARICHNQSFVTSAAALFVWVAIPYRMTWRYTDRGYRYLFLDAGHVCQNLYLASESVGAGVCAIAAYDDNAMNAFLGLDGESAFAIYMATVGKKPAHGAE